MARRIYTPERIINKLREAEVLLSQGGIPGKLLSPLKRRKMIGKVLKTLKVSERRACRVLGQVRSTQRHSSRTKYDEERLVARIIELATRYGRYGYRRITALLKQEGWKVNHKRVERIWRGEGLKVPQRQSKRGRLWLNDGSCIRLKISNIPTTCSRGYYFVDSNLTSGTINGGRSTCEIALLVSWRASSCKVPEC